MADSVEIDAQLAKQEEYNRLTQLYYPIAIWAEAAIWGLYVCLFISTCRIMIKKRAVETTASRIFLVGNSMIFILSTIHNATSVYKLVRAYAQLISPPHPYLYFLEFKRWDNFSHLVVTALCTWIGDVLVIYRCFLIWRRNFWIIVVPVLFLLLSMASVFVNWRWFQHPEDFEMREITPFLYMTFPLNLAQNLLTTGLIAAKIYMQHRTSRASGLQLSSSLNLITIFRIIVESALMYTILTIIIIILFFLNHPAAVIPQHIQPPVIGMVFCFIAIRTHVARNDSVGRSGFLSSFHPTWLSDNNDAPGRRTLNMPITVTTVTEQHDMEVMHMTSTVKLEQGSRRAGENFQDDSKV